ncbi:unnamed protein product [Allacma fusca]|uniref:Uncharacterized protein n=1 Tax=Allacma fusca TaxID=39272 RepID=A0A8J2KMS2_9HEXA|nr:unnamed protein product [Allacma fusca]
MEGTVCTGLTGVFTRIIAWFNILLYLEGLLICLGGCAFYLFEPYILLQEITSIPLCQDFTYHTLKRILMTGILYCLLNFSMGCVLLNGAKLRKVRTLSAWVVYSILVWFVKFMIIFVKSKDDNFPIWVWLIFTASTAFDWICISVVQKYTTMVREYDDIDEIWDFSSDTSSKLSIIVY